MNHLFQSKKINGYQEIISRSPKDPNSYLDFGVLTLEGNNTFEHYTGENEESLTVLSGSVDVSYNGKNVLSIGERADVFQGKPAALYFPSAITYMVKPSRGEKVEIAVSRAKCLKSAEPTVVNPDQLESFWRGKDNWSRLVTMVNVPSTNLIVGEIFNPAGNWSGTPPHKHDTEKPDRETVQEEIYHFRFNRPGGYGIMRLYEETRMEQLYTFRDGDTIRMPTGYHQVVAGPGYELWYIFVLAGPCKDNIVYYDPNDDWLIKS